MVHILNHVSQRIRQYLLTHLSTSNLKKLSFFISLVSCLTSGSIVLFPLFSTSLHKTVGLSYLEINFIASLSAIGMYFCLPVLGYLADSHGPGLLSLISIVFFCPSYFLCAYLVKVHAGSFEGHSYVRWFSTGFFMIGLATSSLYFSSLLTCSKIYPHHQGLSISLPVTCYGLSSLIGSQILKLAYFKEHSDLNLLRTFTFFGCLYFCMGCLNFVSASIVSVDQDVIFNDEESPLLENGVSPSRSVEPDHHKSRFRRFVKDVSAWLLLISLILNIGPLESYQNNLGSILSIVSPSNNLSDKVSLMAAASTVSRLTIGALSDYITSPKFKWAVCRVWLLLMLIVLAAIGQFAHTFNLNYSVIAIINGVAYGGLFTIYPTIVASIWGIDMMGSTWGSFMVAPAIGSVLYSLSYGSEVDSNCGTSQSCLNPYFTATTLSLIVSAVVVLFIWRGLWVKRGFDIF